MDDHNGRELDPRLAERHTPKLICEVWPRAGLLVWARDYVRGIRADPGSGIRCSADRSSENWGARNATRAKYKMAFTAPRSIIYSDALQVQR